MIIMIRFENVSKEYESTETLALSNVSFHIRRGEFAFIIGASGAGKSTITKLITAEEKRTEGNVIINGTDISEIAQNDIPYYRQSIGIVFQDFKLISTKNVYQNIAFALKTANVDSAQIQESVKFVLEMVGLSHKAYVMPNELSGGERQRVALARAMVKNPPVLIADEPTGNLDPQMSADIMNILEAINRSGTTIMVVTHDWAIVNNMHKRVIEISNGNVIRDDRGGNYCYGQQTY